MSPALPVRVSVRRADGSLVGPSAELAAVLGPGPWLVVVPHDDDLVLGMGLTVAAASRQGTAVHVAVSTDGSLGYVRPEERAGLVETRARELDVAVSELGIARERVHRLGFPDGSLIAHQGCRAPSEPPTLAQRLVALMRTVRPTTVFFCTPTDIHPDHRAAAAEAEMACFWASARIWLELGAPIDEPARFEYAVYCPFESAPEVEVSGSEALLQAKLAALSAFASQGVIEPMVERIRADGPFEYLRRGRAVAYRPRTYRGLFEALGRDKALGHGFREDCRMVLDVVRAFPAAGADALERALADATRPMLVVGEGSSQLFPARFAAWLALRGGLGGRVLVAGGREARELKLESYRPCFVSNSGATREIVELARTHGTDAIALVGRAGGPLGALVQTQIAVLPRAEQVVAATASVFGQALYLAQAVLSAAGYRPPLARLERALEAALDVAIEPALSMTWPRVERVFWADPGHGLGAELALKTMEVCGLPGVYAPGNLLLHGIEESLSERDLIVWIEPSPDDRALRDAITRSTGASSVVIGGEQSLWPLDDVGPLTPLVELILGLRIVEALALAHGRDPDRPRRARKIGNPV